MEFLIPKLGLFLIERIEISICRKETLLADWPNKLLIVFMKLLNLRISTHNFLDVIEDIFILLLIGNVGLRDHFLVGLLAGAEECNGITRFR